MTAKTSDIISLCGQNMMVVMSLSFYFKKLRLSDEREREMGKEGLREIGVFLRESLISTSLMVLNGSL